MSWGVSAYDPPDIESFMRNRRAGLAEAWATATPEQRERLAPEVERVLMFDLLRNMREDVERSEDERAARYWRAKALGEIEPDVPPPGHYRRLAISRNGLRL